MKSYEKRTEKDFPMENLKSTIRSYLKIIDSPRLRKNHEPVRPHKHSQKESRSHKGSIRKK